MKFLNRLPKKVLAFGAAFVATAALSAAAMAGFGPDRETRQWTSAENGFEHVTFNSFTGVPGFGDERDFLRGVVTGRDTTWGDPVSDVASTDTITAHIYIHNGADPALNDAPGQPGIAEDVTVSVDIPEGLQDEHEVRSEISSSNALPVTIFDTLDIDSVNDTVFSLDYVPGSVTLIMQDGSTQQLSDAIFTEAGVNIGDQHGCFEFVREITFELEVEKPGYEIEKTARIKGEDSSAWRESVNAAVGDTIEWRIDFRNTGEFKLDDVIVVDDLPSYSEVSAPVKLYNANNRPPEGFTYGDNAVQDDLINIDIDNYTPGSNAVIIVETTIRDDIESIQCGTHRIINVAYATPAGLPTINNNAQVIIQNENPCVEPVAACNTLTALVNGTNGFTGDVNVGDTLNFEAGFTAVEVTDVNFVFTVDGTVVQESATDNTYNYVVTDSDEHTITASIETAEFGSQTSAECSEVLQANAVLEPVYECADFQLAFNDRTATASLQPVAVNGATFKDAQFTYVADGSTVFTQTTDVISNGRVSSTFTFADNAENVRAEAEVRFDVPVDGEVVVQTVDCSASDTLGVTTEEKCEIPGFEHLPKDSDQCVIPNTGAGSIAGIAAVITGLGSFAHRRITLSRQ